MLRSNAGSIQWLDRVRWPLLGLFCLAGLAGGLDAREPAVAQDSAEQTNRWESAIQAFEQADRETPPQKGGVLFLGSSSIRLWNLGQSFPDRLVINRGFGGSEIADSTHFAKRIIAPHQPRTIVLYAGDNDIANGKSAADVAADFSKFVGQARGLVDDVDIAFVAIKPSRARWKLWPVMAQANDLIQRQCAEDPRLHYVDIATEMLAESQPPLDSWFVADGLHLSKEGYARWTKTLGMTLEKIEQPKTEGR